MKYFLLCLLVWQANLIFAAEFSIEVQTGAEVPVVSYPASGDQLLLMLPSEHGFTDGHAQLAADMAKQGIEVWQADLFAAYFLPVAASSLAEFNDNDIASLIDKTVEQSGKAVNLFSHDGGAVPLLKGVRQWQLAGKAKALKSVLLVSPNLYQGTPAVGKEIEYLPIAQQTNFNLYVIQPQLSPKSWQVPALINKLQAAGSDVFIHLMPGVRDRFFFRPDANEMENVHTHQLSAWLKHGLRLAQDFYRPRQIAKSSQTVHPPVKSVASAALKGFRPYQGSFQTQDFTLHDLSGETKKLSDYKGKVVLLNFWASWCPPCIHEMPSMQRLKEGFKGKPFEIVAVNMAEDRTTINSFLKQMNIDFEILLDTNGSVLQQWKVFAYPTSYVLDANGEIRYAGFGAIDWAQPVIVESIKGLFK